MKTINEYLKEALGRAAWDSDAKLAPENVQKYLGLKYNDGSGGGDNEEFINIYFGGEAYGKLAIERGKIEGQDKTFAMNLFGEFDSKDLVVGVGLTSRPMAKKVDIVALYYIDEQTAKDCVKKYPEITNHILCKDINSLVENIRNDYGKVSSYKNIGHKEEKNGIIYTY